MSTPGAPPTQGSAQQPTAFDPADTASALLTWFAPVQRDLPWRHAKAGARDPYLVLVSELMLQQTQAARVAQRFPGFIARFPTLADLANAPEQDVLAAWAGLGYYRRAKNLHAAARAILTHHAGQWPTDPAALRALPGIGEYTAGAIASIAFGLPHPAVDGNVTRVLLRLHASDADQASPATRRWATDHAAALAQASGDPGSLNEALMELGATTCTPRAPACPRCPLAHRCAAASLNLQAHIPRPKARRPPKDLFAAVAVAPDPNTPDPHPHPHPRLLAERRGPKGLWAGLWQLPTLERPDRHPTPRELADHLGPPASPAPAPAILDFTHQTTHRTVHLRAYRIDHAPALQGREFLSPQALLGRGVGNAHRRILLAVAPASAEPASAEPASAEPGAAQHSPGIVKA